MPSNTTADNISHGASFSNVVGLVLASIIDPPIDPIRQGIISHRYTFGTLRRSFLYPYAVARPPGQTAMLAVAFATMGASPYDSSTGYIIMPPPPAKELIRPVIIPAPNKNK